MKWVGTDSGLAVFNNGIWTIYNSSNTPILPAGNITSIVTNNQGEFWASIDDGGFFPLGYGLIYFTETNGTITSWHLYDTSNSNLPSNLITGLKFSGGKLWIGTNNGFVQFDSTNMAVYNTTNSGLLDNNINKMALDSSGRIYFATNHFVSILEEHSINSYVSEKNYKKSFNLYPNPATTELKISHNDGNNHPVRCELFDATGKLAKSFLWPANDKEFIIKLNGLEIGLYLLRLSSNEEEYIETFRVVIE